MSDTINDIVFGKMDYKYGWEKIEKINFWGKAISLRIVASAFDKHDINEKQRENYKYFTVSTDEVSKKSLEAVKKYLIDHRSEYKISENVDDAYIRKTLMPQTVVFQEDGSFGVLCDSIIDVENGIGVQVKPDYVVGPQDILL
jgi:hypothetical protein